jgi:hypothetical protein
LLVTGCVLVAAGAVGYLMGEQLAAALGALVEDGLSDAVLLRSDPGAALAAGLGRGLILILPLLAVPAAAGLTAALVPAIAARRGGGETAVPIPRRARRFSRGVLTLVALAVFALAALAILRGHGDLIARSIAGASSGMAWVGELVASLVLVAGATTLLAGVADLALDRARLLGELALRPADALREERAASGDPGVRARMRSQSKPNGGPR